MPSRTIEPFRPDWRVHPGEVLQEVLDERGMTQTYLAWATGYTQKHINFVVKGRSAITAALAVRLERELEVSAKFWMAAQAGYDLQAARQEMEAAELRSAGG